MTKSVCWLIFRALIVWPRVRTGSFVVAGDEVVAPTKGGMQLLVPIAFREIVNFSNTIFFRQHKWITKLFFNNTTKKVFICSMEYGLLLMLQDSWSLGLLVLEENGLAGCWEGSVCCWMCEGLYLKSPCSFVSGIWGRVCVISINVSQRWNGS